MRNPAECLALAEECEQKAAQTMSPRLKTTYMEIAKTWRRLGSQPESVEHDRSRAANDRTRLSGSDPGL